MNFGNFGIFEMMFVLLIWGLPIVLLIWFVRTLTAMSVSLRDIAERLASVERAIKDASRGRAT